MRVVIERKLDGKARTSKMIAEKKKRNKVSHIDKVLRKHTKKNCRDGLETTCIFIICFYGIGFS